MLRLALPHVPTAAAAAAIVSRPALSLLLRPLAARLISSSAVPPNMATTGIANAQRTAFMARAAFGGKQAQASLTDRLKTKRTPPQIVSADEAVKNVPSNSRVYVHGAACTPSVLLDALSKRDDVSGIEFMHLHLEGPNPCMAYPDRFYSNNLFVGAAERANVAQGKGSYIPLFLSEMGRVMRQGVATPKVALLNVSPPDKHGFVTLGAEVACSLPAVETADILIAQINPHMIKARGSGFLPFNAFDYVVPTPNAAMHQSPMAPISDVERRIGQHIAGMVEDGATLQMGIGAVPNAVLAELKNHKHLGIHTEMFSDGVIELIKSGVVDNSQKVYQKGRTVTSFVVGSQALYDFVDDNPQVLFQEAAVTNDPVVIGSNPKVTAINSAVAVDLTGQVAADSVGIYQVSGVGGQIDFERGAAISRGGLPIICLPSTNLKDGSSKIVNMLWPGTGITTTRYHAHYIVTEHGIASLFGQNYHERARRLITIAHPDHREQLEKEAFERFRIKAWRV